MILWFCERGDFKKDGNKVFNRPCRDRTWCNGFKQKDGGFRLDIRNYIFTRRVLKQWNKLPRVGVDAPSLENFTIILDRALSNLV